MELLSKSWYTSHLRTITRLLQEPADAELGPAEPVLEVAFSFAELGPLPREANHRVQAPFVRLWMDGQLIGETSVYTGGDTRRPVWNERFLVLPRGSWCSRVEVCEVLGGATVRCHCAVGTETLWKAAAHTGGFSVAMPLRHEQTAVGVLHAHVRMWDGQPIQDTPWWAAGSRQPASLSIAEQQRQHDIQQSHTHSFPGKEVVLSGHPSIKNIHIPRSIYSYKRR